MNKNAGYIWALICVTMWSFNGIIASAFATRMTPIELTFGRWAIAALVLFPFVAMRFKELIPTLKKHWFLIITLSIIGMVLPNFAVYMAGHTTSAINISLINRISPIFLVILSAVLLKTGVSLKQITGILVAFLGVVLLVLKGDLERLWTLNFARGDLWILVSAFSFSLYSILQSKRPQELSQTMLLGVNAIISALILLPFFVYGEVTHSHLKELNIQDWLVLLYLGTGLSIVGYFSWNSALQLIGAVRAGAVSYLSPVLTGIWAYFLLGNDLLYSQLIGGIFVLFGICLINAKKQPKDLNGV